jgi:hypothetical protein
VRRVAIGPAVLEFAAQDPLARPVIAALYHAATPSPAAATLHYRIERVIGGWCAFSPAKPPFGPAPLEDVFSFLEWRATEDVLSAGGAVFLHAAGLRLGTRQVLLVGESGAGKSSLAAQLLVRGYLAWGDDLVRFAPEVGRFSTVPRSWKLDAKTMESIYLVSLLSSEGAPGTLLANSVLYMSPAALRRRWQAPEARADVVVLLDRASHGQAPGVERMSAGEGALRTARMLLGGGVNRTEGGAMMVRVLEALSGVTAYRAGGTPPAALARLLEQELAA